MGINSITSNSINNTANNTFTQNGIISYLSYQLKYFQEACGRKFVVITDNYSRAVSRCSSITKPVAEKADQLSIGFEWIGIGCTYVADTKTSNPEAKALFLSAGAVFMLASASFTLMGSESLPKRIELFTKRMTEASITGIKACDMRSTSNEETMEVIDNADSDIAIIAAMIEGFETLSEEGIVCGLFNLAKKVGSNICNRSRNLTATTTPTDPDVEAGEIKCITLEHNQNTAMQHTPLGSHVSSIDTKGSYFSVRL